MPIERKLSEDELFFGILMHDPFLFPLFFWEADLTIPPTRKDLPEEWRGKQVVGKNQKLMFCDESQRILFCTGRKIAKTLMIERDVIQYGMINDRNDGGLDEAMFFTPGDAHIAPVRARIFSKVQGVPLFRMFIKERPNKTEGGAGTLVFKTGLKWHLRIEGVSGTDTNMAGLRAKFMLGDELAFGNWICHNSRGQTALPDARWKYCGVPNGVRTSPFFSLDQTSLGADWSRHKYDSKVNPLYASKEAWQRLISFYGGVNTHGFITQVLGEWGTETFSSFPPGTIAAKSLPFYYRELTNKDISGDLSDAFLGRVIRLPEGISHVGIHQAVIGWDYGVSPDPCVINVFYRTSPEDINWYQALRLRIMRVPLPHQCRIIEFITYMLLGNKVSMVCTDYAGGVQMLQFGERYGPKFRDRVVWANSAGTEIRMDAAGFPLTDESGKEMTVRRKEWGHDLFRNGMQYALIRVPHDFYMWLAESDELLITELSGTIERRRGSGYIEYIAPRKTMGSKSPDDHNTDSCRYGAIAIHDAMGIGRESGDPSFDEFAAAMGWAGGDGDDHWAPPWDPPEAMPLPTFPLN